MPLRRQTNFEILLLFLWIIFTLRSNMQTLKFHTVLHSPSNNSIRRNKINATLKEHYDQRIPSSLASQNAIYYEHNPTVEEFQREDVYDYSDALCPELASAYEYYLKKSPAAELSVAMVQLVGNWSEVKTTQLMRDIFQHNARLVRRHNYHVIPIEKIPHGQLLFPKDELNSPPFWKMQAIRNVCREINPDIVWFLDGDIVLMNPTYRIDVLWEYHRQWAEFDGMGILFSHDMNGINSGAFIVNCTSALAMKFLKMLIPMSFQVRKMPDVDPDLFEQNTIHYLLDTPQWKSSHVRPRRTASDGDWTLFSPVKLRRRIRTTLQPCSMFTLPLIIDHPCTYDQRGPLWYEFGHVAVHTAGMRQIKNRSSYLLRRLQQAKNLVVDQKTSDTKSVIVEYLRDHRYQKSVLRMPCKELYSI
jgi:galactosyl transferase GMA12/MNN10 family